MTFAISKTKSSFSTCFVYYFILSPFDDDVQLASFRYENFPAEP